MSFTSRLKNYFGKKSSTAHKNADAMKSFKVKSQPSRGEATPVRPDTMNPAPARHGRSHLQTSQRTKSAGHTDGSSSAHLPVTATPSIPSASPSPPPTPAPATSPSLPTSDLTQNAEQQFKVAKLKRDLKASNEELLAERKVNSELRDLLTIQRTELAEYKALREANRSRLEALKEWCDESMIVPGKESKRPNETFVANTLARAQALLTRKDAQFQDLRLQRNFRSPELWALYWLLAHACREAAKSARSSTENGASSKFAEALIDRAEKMREAGLSDISDAIKIDRIYDNKAPDIREVHVGADLLLVLAGKPLIGSDGVVLIWLQAKAGSQSRLSLNYWRDVRTPADKVADSAHEELVAEAEKEGTDFEADAETVDGLRQVEALAQVNQPERGSFGLYLKYLPGLELCATVPVTAIPTPYGLTRRECHLGIGEFSVRAQEELCLLAAQSKNRAFTDAQAAANFILNCALQPADIQAVAPKNDDHAWDLVMSLKQTYEQGIEARSEYEPLSYVSSTPKG